MSRDRKGLQCAALAMNHLQSALECLQVGLGVAMKVALQQGLPSIWERIQQLACKLRQELNKMDQVTVQDRGRRLCGIVSFTVVCSNAGTASVWMHAVNWLHLVHPCQGTLRTFAARARIRLQTSRTTPVMRIWGAQGCVPQHVE